MKRIRCPKCSNPITFDETKYELTQTLAFICPTCGKKFAIRLSSKAQADDNEETSFGAIVVIENVFHYKQVIPLSLGDNFIGRYQKGVDNNCPIHTDDPSIDITHCVITVSKDKRGRLKYVLRDGPSNTGTFVDNVILGDRERRVIEPGRLFTIGATSVILKDVVDDNNKEA